MSNRVKLAWVPNKFDEGFVWGVDDVESNGGKILYDGKTYETVAGVGVINKLIKESKGANGTYVLVHVTGD